MAFSFEVQGGPKLLGQCVYRCVIFSIYYVPGAIQGPFKMCTSVCQVKMNESRFTQRSHLKKCLYCLPIQGLVG